ncbi:hypothetical protein EGW08_011196 [Elysia chlorotica]|uniref:Sodium/nucleoside cotransporter n=1 Tax=Elysia chlorotica TaxID=188477 RepID=A0A433THI6_ELYCH|nr:hypothetical protein EGW08_011196 [Elysia chlorotica]
MDEKEIRLTAFKDGESAAKETHSIPLEDDEEKSLSKEHGLLAEKGEENQTLKQDETEAISQESGGDTTKAMSALIACRQTCKNTFLKNRPLVKKVFKIICFIGVCVYLGFAFHHSFGDEQSLTLLGVVCFAVGYCIISRCIRKYEDKLKHTLGDAENSKCVRISKLVYWWTLGLLLVALVAYVLVDSVLKRPQNLLSLVGVVVFPGLLLLLSTRPQQVRWRPVIGGILLQFVFGVLVLKTQSGLRCFQWLADRVTEYLDHTNHGAKFVFGQSFTDHYFAFKVLPCIIVFSATISILYYLGAMQVAISAVTAVMRLTLDSGPMETLHAAFNIFVGWAETVPVVKPLLDDMTLSELHAVMTNGFATVSGGTLAAYILYGAPANHLISASFMSAPAALAMSKLFYPENCRRKRRQTVPEIKSSERGVIEAASAGAISAIPVIAYIVVHLIAFLSILDFVNSTLAWLGARVGLAPPNYPVLSFQYVCSYLMWPLALIMGVDLADCRPVARMLGIKVFVNEFLAFEDLGIMRANNRILQNYTMSSSNATWHWTPTDDIILDATGQVLPGGAISERSTTIATYALCGFSDLVALGIMVGAFSAVAPSRRRDFLQVAPRALVAGITACFLTAAMAGLMVD